MLSITVPGVSADLSQPLRKRDPLCQRDNDGVRFLFDMAFRWCYAEGTASASKAVKDMAEREDTQLTVRAAQSVPLVSNGLDFSGTDLPGCYVAVKPSVMADLWTAQQFLVCMYLTLPSLADWAVATKALFQGSDSGQSFNGAPDIGFIGYGSGAASLSFRRQTAVGATQTLVLGAGAIEAYGKFAQVAMWRTGSAFACRVKTKDLTTGTSAAAGDLNTADFSAATGGFGMPIGFWSYNGLSADELKLNNFKLHRGFIENLARSGRDPVAVLDADWERQVARGVWSI